MKPSWRPFFAGASCVLPLLPLTGCKDRNERIAADLGEAGYAMTADGWFKAAAADDVAVMKRFVEGGFAADTRDEAGATALHAAAAAGAENAADFLLRRGLSLDLKDNAGRTPLMAAVTAGQSRMTGWLLRYGADPRVQDPEGFNALMLAVRENAAGPIAELAPYLREDLDNALLLASLLGHPESIDMLTNYGASVYARMEDGRTPLMMAAQNGHEDAVKLLVDIGASRFATDERGLSAADHAREAGHPELVDLILHKPLPDELALESPEEIADEMAAFVAEAEDPADAGAEASAREDDGADVPVAAADGPVAAADVTASAADGATPPATRPRGGSPPPPPPLAGRRLGGTAGPAAGQAAAVSDPAQEGTSRQAAPPLVMRHYREREIPLEVGAVSGGSVSLRVRGTDSAPVEVSPGETIPGSRLEVVQIHRRMETSKVSPDVPVETSVVEVADPVTGARREWRTGLPATAHDPLALVEDAATGERYVASPGQTFSGPDGTEYTVVDVRPNQIVIEDSSGSVHTLPLRGPRG